MRSAVVIVIVIIEARKSAVRRSLTNLQFLGPVARVSPLAKWPPQKNC